MLRVRRETGVLTLAVGMKERCTATVNGALQLCYHELRGTSREPHIAPRRI